MTEGAKERCISTACNSGFSHSDLEIFSWVPNHLQAKDENSAVPLPQQTFCLQFAIICASINTYINRTRDFNLVLILPTCLPS